MGPIGKALGMGAKKSMPMMGDDEEEGEDYSSPSSDPLAETEEETSSVPPEFQSAYEEWEASPSVETTYRMIEACKSGGGEKPGGLELILGGKGKKA